MSNGRIAPETRRQRKNLSGDFANNKRFNQFTVLFQCRTYWRKNHSAINDMRACYLRDGKIEKYNTRDVTSRSIQKEISRTVVDDILNRVHTAPTASTRSFSRLISTYFSYVFRSIDPIRIHFFRSGIQLYRHSSVEKRFRTFQCTHDIEPFKLQSNAFKTYVMVQFKRKYFSVPGIFTRR